MPSHPVGGFDLRLGRLYNAGWFNEEEPMRNSLPCPKCQAPTILHRLQKLVVAFGKVTTQHGTIRTCPNCLHEQELEILTVDKPLKATKQNLVKIFSKLPKAVQEQLLLQGNKS